MADAGASGVVDDFHAALARGDTAVAERLLSTAAIVFEGGSAERSRAEYASAHLAADAAFEQAVGSQMVRRNGGTSGDMAWVASEGRTKGLFKGRDVDRVTTETMVLQRISGTWKIVHVHWSSHAGTGAHCATAALWPRQWESRAEARVRPASEPIRWSRLSLHDLMHPGPAS